MRKPLSFLLGGLLCATVLFTPSCDDDETLDANDIGGDVNIPLTEVGSESTMYITMGGVELPPAEMTVLSRVNGRVTFGIVMDITDHPYEDVIRSVVRDQHFDANGNLNTAIDMKFTSEGIVDYEFTDKPWVVGKYADGVGAQYTVESSDGLVRTRTVTEKTGVDEWPLVFWYIKTSEITQDFSMEDNEHVEKVTFRINHRFGLVNMGVHLRTGEHVDVDIVPWHLL